MPGSLTDSSDRLMHPLAGPPAWADLEVSLFPVCCRGGLLGGPVTGGLMGGEAWAGASMLSKRSLGAVKQSTIMLPDSSSAQQSRQLPNKMIIIVIVIIMSYRCSQPMLGTY